MREDLKQTIYFTWHQVNGWGPCNEVLNTWGIKVNLFSAEHVNTYVMAISELPLLSIDPSF